MEAEFKVTQSHESRDVKYTQSHTDKAVDSPLSLQKEGKPTETLVLASETSNFKNCSSLNMEHSLQASMSTIGSAMFRGSQNVRRLAYWVEGGHLCWVLGIILFLCLLLVI